VDLGTKRNAASSELFVQLDDARLELRAFHAHMEVADAELEQLLVGERHPGGPEWRQDLATLHAVDCSIPAKSARASSRERPAGPRARPRCRSPRPVARWRGRSKADGGSRGFRRRER